MTRDQIIDLARKVRQAQSSYYRTKFPGEKQKLLVEARQLEVRLDKALAAELQPDPPPTSEQYERIHAAVVRFFKLLDGPAPVAPADAEAASDELRACVKPWPEFPPPTPSAIA